jgi:hypothetical protein
MNSGYWIKLPICACGECGLTVIPRVRKGRRDMFIPKYINGHNRKGVVGQWDHINKRGDNQ